MNIRLLEYVHRNARIILPLYSPFAITPTVHKDAYIDVYWHFFFRFQNQNIEAPSPMIFVTMARTTCLTVILSPDPLKYLFDYLINLDFSLGARN